MSIEYAWYDFVGNIGVLIILGSYLGVQLDRIDARTVLFSAMNAAGAGMITLSLCFDFNLSAFVIEVAWLVISLYGILRRLTNPPTAPAR